MRQQGVDVWSKFEELEPKGARESYMLTAHVLASIIRFHEGCGKLLRGRAQTKGECATLGATAGVSLRGDVL